MRWIWIKGDPPLPESILQIQAERIPEGHGTRPQTRPEGLRLCFDPITALRPCAPGAAISDCACRPRQSYRISGENDRLHPSNQFGSITGERHEKAVRRQANVRVKAKSAEERRGALTPEHASLSDDGPASASSRKGSALDADVRTADRLFGPSVGRGRSMRAGRPPPTVRPNRHFNLKERFGCRFAADAAIGDRRHNRLLQLAAAGTASSGSTGRAGCRCGVRPRPLERLPREA